MDPTKRQDFLSFSKAITNGAPAISYGARGVLLHSQRKSFGAKQSSSSEGAEEKKQEEAKPTATASNAAEISEPLDVIVIHVCDESRKLNKDFRCSMKLLLTEMKYFQTYLSGTSRNEDIDISVHCDVGIFEWLMQYMHNPANQPKLEVGNVVSILISSAFLQMSHLADQCLVYMKAHINEIVKMPIDLNCLNSQLLGRLAALTTEDELDKIKDRKDKLVSKLYMKRLEALLELEANRLFRCLNCGKLFTSSQREWMQCSKAKIFIDYHGNVVAKHVPHPSWELSQYLQALRSRKLSWREIFWKLWGALHSMTCIVCKNRFLAAELGHCSFHRSEPIFVPGNNIGTYPCCGATAVRFDPSSGVQQGCSARNHVVQPDSPDAALLQAMLPRYTLVALPFPPPACDPDDPLYPYNHLPPAQSDPSQKPPPPAKPYSPLGDSDRGESDGSASDNFDGLRDHSDSDSGSSEGGGARGNGSAGGTAQRASKPPLHPRTKSKHKKALKAPSFRLQQPANPAEAEASGKKKRLWKLDAQRDDDALRMDTLVALLQKCRKDSRPNPNLSAAPAGPIRPSSRAATAAAPNAAATHRPRSSASSSHRGVSPGPSTRKR